MSEKVVALFGTEVIDTNRPCTGVIEKLEHALAAAKRGELRAIVIGAVTPGNGFRFYLDTGSEPSLVVVGMAHMVAVEVVRDWEERCPAVAAPEPPGQPA
jgi:hypothetical protein